MASNNLAGICPMESEVRRWGITIMSAIDKYSGSLLKDILGMIVTRFFTDSSIPFKKLELIANVTYRDDPTLNEILPLIKNFDAVYTNPN